MWLCLSFLNVQKGVFLSSEGQILQLLSSKSNQLIEGSYHDSNDGIQMHLAPVGFEKYSSSHLIRHNFIQSLETFVTSFRIWIFFCLNVNTHSYTVYAFQNAEKRTFLTKNK